MNRTWHKTILFALSFSFLLTQILFAQNKSQPAQRWEYKTINCNDTELGKLGDEGWELVSTSTNSGNCYQYLLKRLKPVNAPKYVDPQAAPPKKEEPPTCKLTAAQAPTVRGLRLGMTVDELIELFPGANPNNLKGRVEEAKGYWSFGKLGLNFPGTQHKDRLDKFSFGVSLFDGRVESFFVQYPFNNSSPYGRVYSKEQLIDKLVKSFGLPANEKWRDEYNAWLSLECQGFTLKVDYRGELNISVKDNSKSIEEQIKQRQAEDGEKKRAAFIP